MSNGFQVGGERADLFRSTADDYARYRRPYPRAVVDYLITRCRLSGCGRLLDAGCGTGQVFQVIAQYFGEVVAIDSDLEMVAYARKTAGALGLMNVVVRQLDAEEFEADSGSLRMAIFGASFHWMDRPRVGEKIYDL